MSASGVVLVVIGVILSMSLPAVAQERQLGGIGLTVFADRSFHGRSATLRNDTPNLRTIGLNDAASSLRAGPGEQWEVCDLPNYMGRCVVVSGSEANLRQSGWDNMISSARLLSGGGTAPPIRPPIQPMPTGLELFSRTQFAGDRRVISNDEADLRRSGFDDRARSLRIRAGETWEVCADTSFRNCLVVNSDWRDLNGVRMSQRISSVRRWRQGGGVGDGNRVYLMLFDDRGFRGRSIRLTRESPLLVGFANLAESVRVGGGSWQLCDRRDFAGQCVVVSGDIPDLGSLGLRNRVQSARPVPMPR